MRQYLLFFFLLFSVQQIAVAQETKGFSDRLFYGGNFGLGFNAFNGSSYFYGDISPIVGYKITPKVIIGPGAVYQYINQRIPVTTTRKLNLNYHNYGIKGFNRILFTQKLFTHIEAELLSFQYLAAIDGSGAPQINRIEVFSFFVGGGYRQMINQNSSFDLLVLFNLNDNIYSPYSNPVIRVGLGFNW